MNQVQVSMSELRQRLGDLVNQAAYGRERVVLVSHGQPKAAIIGVEDLRRLLQLDQEFMQNEDDYLEAARALRERIQRWQEAHGIAPEDSVETLSRIREEHDHELSGVR